MVKSTRSKGKILRSRGGAKKTKAKSKSTKKSVRFRLPTLIKHVKKSVRKSVAPRRKPSVAPRRKPMRETWDWLASVQSALPRGTAGKFKTIVLKAVTKSSTSPMSAKKTIKDHIIFGAYNLTAEDKKLISKAMSTTSIY